MVLPKKNVQLLEYNLLKMLSLNFFCQKSVGHICVGLFLSSLLCFIDLSLALHQHEKSLYDYQQGMVK